MVEAVEYARQDAHGLDWNFVVAYAGKHELIAQYSDLYAALYENGGFDSTVMVPRGRGTIRRNAEFTACGFWTYSRETFSHWYLAGTGLEAMELAIFQHAPLSECTMVGAIAGRHEPSITQENLPDALFG